MESGTLPARKVLLVADPTRESAGALEYAISNVVSENDELILLHVEHPYSRRNTYSFLKKSNLSSTSFNLNLEAGGEVDFLDEMARNCELAQPKVSIRRQRLYMDARGRDRDKANAVLDRSEMLGVDLIIIGQKQSLSRALLGYKVSGAGLKAFDTAEYLIEKSKCNCVEVQRKGQNAGYLLN